MDNIVLIPVPLNELLAAFQQLIDNSIAKANLNSPQATIEPLTQKQLAKYLGVTEQTIIRYRAKKRIPFYFVGSSPRFNLNEVLKSLGK